MSTKKGFIPNRDGDEKTWVVNLRTVAPSQAATLSISVADLATINTSCNDIENQINLAMQAQQVAKQATATKKAKVKVAETNLRGVIKRLKSSPNYTDAIGKLLGIVGEDHVVDEANSAPELKLHKVPSGWQIDFNLQDHFDGVNIYKKLSTAASATFLARDTASPYIDTTAVDNGTQYYAYYVMHDEEVGLVSNTAVVSV